MDVVALAVATALAVYQDLVEVRLTGRVRFGGGIAMRVLVPVQALRVRRVELWVDRAEPADRRVVETYTQLRQPGRIGVTAHEALRCRPGRVAASHVAVRVHPALRLGQVRGPEDQVVRPGRIRRRPGQPVR